MSWRRKNEQKAVSQSERLELEAGCNAITAELREHWIGLLQSYVRPDAGLDFDKEDMPAFLMYFGDVIKPYTERLIGYVKKLDMNTGRRNPEEKQEHLRFLKEEVLFAGLAQETICNGTVALLVCSRFIRQVTDDLLPVLGSNRRLKQLVEQRRSIEAWMRSQVAGQTDIPDFDHEVVDSLTETNLEIIDTLVRVLPRSAPWSLGLSPRYYQHSRKLLSMISEYISHLEEGKRSIERLYELFEPDEQPHGGSATEPETPASYEPVPDPIELGKQAELTLMAAAELASAYNMTTLEIERLGLDGLRHQLTAGTIIEGYELPGHTKKEVRDFLGLLKLVRDIIESETESSFESFSTAFFAELGAEQAVIESAEELLAQPKQLLGRGVRQRLIEAKSQLHLRTTFDWLQQKWGVVEPALLATIPAEHIALRRLIVCRPESEAAS